MPLCPTSEASCWHKEHMRSKGHRIAGRWRQPSTRRLCRPQHAHCTQRAERVVGTMRRDVSRSLMLFSASVAEVRCYEAWAESTHQEVAIQATFCWDVDSPNGPFYEGPTRDLWASIALARLISSHSRVRFRMPASHRDRRDQASFSSRYKLVKSLFGVLWAGEN